MRFTNASKFRMFAPLALGLIALFGVLSLQAGETFSTDLVAAPQAAPPSNPPLNVAEANKDANGYIRVHEQGTVTISGTVNVGNTPKTQDVNIVNEALDVKLPNQGTTKFYDVEVDFNEGFLQTIDIHEYNHVRFATVVNGSGTVEFFLSTDGGVKSHFEVEAAGQATVDLGQTPGTKLTIQLVDPDGEQVFLRVFGSN